MVGAPGIRMVLNFNFGANLIKLPFLIYRLHTSPELPIFREPKYSHREIPPCLCLCTPWPASLFFAGPGMYRCTETNRRILCARFPPESPGSLDRIQYRIFFRPQQTDILDNKR